MCEHELDIMGCQFVMPGDYTNNSFTSCDGEPAVPPGLYPLPGGGTSTFRQAFTYTANGETIRLGQTVTPAAPFSTPATSNCVTTSTIGNGLAVAQATQSAAASSGSAAAAGASGASASGSGAARSSGASRVAGATNSAGSAAAAASSGAVGAGSRSASSNGGLAGLVLSAGVVLVGGLAVLI